MTKAKDKKKQELAELLGMTAPAVGEEAIQRNRKQEAILAYLGSPKLFSRQHCLNCGEPFLVNRSNVAYCGGLCRKDALRKKGFHGIELINTEPKGEDDEQWVHDKWWGDEPLIVPPSAVNEVNALVESTKISTPEPLIDSIENAPDKITDKAGLAALLNMTFD